MKAAQLTKYGRNFRIGINSLSLPSVGSHDVQVKVIYAGVNPLDNLIARGTMKLLVPYRLPQTMGNELVGRITRVGDDVQNFHVGERVFARMPLDRIGAFAEDVIINSAAIARVPECFTDEEAATIPLTALTAMQALDLMDVEPGKTLFISGGTGSFGAMAIPIAVAKGLTVIVSGSARNKDTVMKLGVSRFIDYRKKDYSQELSHIDLAIDTLGGKELEKQMSILKPHGTIVSLRAMPNAEFARREHMGKAKELLFKLASAQVERMAKKYHVHYHFMNVDANGQQLHEAAEILAHAHVHPLHGDVFSLNQTKEAMDRVARGHNRGKILLKLSE